jgi:hypothetical protein
LPDEWKEWLRLWPVIELPVTIHYVRAEQARDRAYWDPLRRELEQFRREHRDR